MDDSIEGLCVEDGPSVCRRDIHRNPSDGPGKVARGRRKWSRWRLQIAGQDLPTLTGQVEDYVCAYEATGASDRDVS